jgi:hypothetical protein
LLHSPACKAAAIQASSDVDLLASFTEPIGFGFIHLADRLEALLGRKQWGHERRVDRPYASCSPAHSRNALAASRAASASSGPNTSAGSSSPRASG